MPQTKSEVFICYCQADRRWLDRLLEMMAPIKESHGISLWADPEIEPGKPFLIEINQALARASVALLLVTPGFLNSKFIKEYELPRILAAQDRGLQVLWVPLKLAMYEHAPIAHLQAVFDPAKFWNQLTAAKKHEAFTVVAKAVMKALDAGVEPAEPLVQISRPHNDEVRGRDEMLRDAINARFIALTYQTLGLAFTNGGLKLRDMQEIEIAVYALPILKKWHPTLRDRIEQLTNEWITGVTQVLTALTDPHTAPALELLNVRIVNRIPTLTASQLTSTTTDNKSVVRIRYTPVLEDEAPANTPTIIVTREFSEQSQAGDVFDAYARILENMCTRGRPLLYPVLRLGSSRYVRNDIPAFVRKLAAVTNRKDYLTPDVQFEKTRVRIESQLAEATGFPVTSGNGVIEMTPDHVYRIFDHLRLRGLAEEFRVEVSFARKEVTIEAGPPSANRWVEGNVTAIHKIGVFALLTKKDSSDLKVYFREKEKGTWPWDVPGGKVALGDVSHSDTAARELFEELGMIVYDGRLSHIIAAKYDPKSAKEGVPVIALYCHYELANAEASYIEKILPDGADGQKLVAHSVREVIREKRDRRQSWEKGTGKDQYEAVCHAPLEALLAVAERSKIPIGKTRAAAAGKARR